MKSCIDWYCSSFFICLIVTNTVWRCFDHHVKAFSQSLGGIWALISNCFDHCAEAAGPLREDVSATSRKAFRSKSEGVSTTVGRRSTSLWRRF